MWWILRVGEDILDAENRVNGESRQHCKRRDGHHGVDVSSSWFNAHMKGRKKKRTLFFLLHFNLFKIKHNNIIIIIKIIK